MLSKDARLPVILQRQIQWQMQRQKQIQIQIQILSKDARLPVMLQRAMAAEAEAAREARAKVIKKCLHLVHLLQKSFFCLGHSSLWGWTSCTHLPRSPCQYDDNTCVWRWLQQRENRKPAELCETPARYYHHPGFTMIPIYRLNCPHQYLSLNEILITDSSSHVNFFVAVSSLKSLKYVNFKQKCYLSWLL